ncbi:DNA-binding protein [candidate division WOR-3 bacterium]|nr:DNA-binding protein [candidate division WOR-3 bacterium]
MKEFKVKNGIFLILEVGEEVIKSIKDFCAKEGIFAGVLQGIGSLTDIELGYFDLKEKQYKRKKIKGVYELLSLSGNLSKKDDKILPHIHVIVGSDKYDTKGGHLFSAKVAVTCEIFIIPSKGRLIRRFDKKTDLFLIKEIAGM